MEALLHTLTYELMVGALVAGALAWVLFGCLLFKARS